MVARCRGVCVVIVVGIRRRCAWICAVCVQIAVRVPKALQWVVVEFGFDAVFVGYCNGSIEVVVGISLIQFVG